MVGRLPAYTDVLLNGVYDVGLAGAERHCRQPRRDGAYPAAACGNNTCDKSALLHQRHKGAYQALAEYGHARSARLPGITLVVSPLVSLMKDQVGALVQAGVYKARERIHRAMADARLLANPASWSRVADSNPN